MQLDFVGWIFRKVTYLIIHFDLMDQFSIYYVLTRYEKLIYLPVIISLPFCTAHSYTLLQSSIWLNHQRLFISILEYRRSSKSPRYNNLPEVNEPSCVIFRLAPPHSLKITNRNKLELEIIKRNPELTFKPHKSENRVAEYKTLAL